MSLLFASITWTYGLSSAAALSAVALVGYLFGRVQTKKPNQPPAGELAGDCRDLQRAAQIAGQLETIADDLRNDLSLHHGQVERFKQELHQAQIEGDQQAVERLRKEAEAMVAPTLQLVSQLSSAYDNIRQQSRALANFTGGRTDPLTGLANGRSLEEHLAVLLETTGNAKQGKAQNGTTVAVVGLDAGNESCDREEQERHVQRLGQTLAGGLRGDDFAARYGVEEFVVVLPATRLAGASVFGARLRANLDSKFGLSACCGLAESLPGDTPKSLLARADSAAYSARAAGTGQQYLHTGAAIRPDTRRKPIASAEAGSKRAEPKSATKEPVLHEAEESYAAIVVGSLAGPPVEGDLVGGRS